MSRRLERERVKVWMQVIVSIVALAAGIYLVATAESQQVRELAAGWTGLILGYWLSQ